jgi:spore germination protein KA
MLTDKKISLSIEKNLSILKKISSDSSDLLINDFYICNKKCLLVCCEGMLSTNTISDLILSPITDIKLPESSSAKDISDYIMQRMLLSTDRTSASDFKECFRFINSGFAVLFIDGLDKSLAFGVQGYASKGISEPTGENNILGSQEGFTETIRTNMSLIRRRMKSPLLKMHLFIKGEISQTDMCLCYLSDRVPKKLIRSIYKSLNSMKLDTILSGGYVQPFIENRKGYFFDTVSQTQRPDVLCSKLLEGRVALLIDGTPFAIVIPKLFCESFQTLDDYNLKPYYATISRLIKYLAFWISLLLPCIYISVVYFSPQLLNSKLLMILWESEQSAPFPLWLETLGIFIIYEIIREAGLRLPKAMGSSVSIIAGLIIGDAAVTSGLISTPLLTVSAIAIISGLVVPDLNQALTALRFVFIISAAFMGLFGTAIVLATVIFNLCAMDNFGFPTLAPIVPFYKKSMGDVFTRINFRKMQSRNFTVEEYYEQNK